MKTIKFFAAISFIALMFMGCDKNKDVTPDADLVAFEAADGITGARLYDHVLNQVGITDTKLTEQPNFFRCKSCHGWDLLGQGGVLIDKPSSSTYPVAFNGSLMEVRQNDGIREIFDAIKNNGGRSTSSGTYNSSMPAYGEILTDAQIWDLVKFIKETAHDVNDFYGLNTAGSYPNGTKEFIDIGRGGDAAAGLVTYNANCASCHGADGTGINIYCKGEYLGDMFRDDPHEIQHKAIWGMPIDNEHIAAGCTEAGMMPAQAITDQDIRNMMVMGQDPIAFPGYK
jgi:mono/diheme cytochrome c family protein